MSKQKNEALSTTRTPLNPSTNPQNPWSEAMPTQTNEAQSTIPTTLNSNTHSQSNEVAMSPVIPFTKPNAEESIANDEAFIEQAKAIPESEVLACRSDVYAAVSAIVAGAHTLEKPEVLESIRELPGIDVEALRKLPELGQAVVRATKKIIPVEKDPGTAALVERGTALRKLMRDQMQLLVTMGLVDPKEVETTKVGRTSMDLSQHLKMCAAVLTRCSKEVPLSVSHGVIEEAQALAESLWEASRRAADAAEAQSAHEEALALRDRLWTLLVRNHKQLRRAARFLWEDEADAFVPPLKRGPKGPRKAKAAAGDEGKNGKENGTVTEQPVIE